MESRKFIREAAVAMDRIANSQNTIGTAEQMQNQRESIQQEVSRLFTGLQNPTLPSAYRLRDAAQRAGYFVNPMVLQRLRDHEFLGV
jgi:hypothetical protein